MVYFAAVVQGLALVTFPAASSIFTSPDGFGFDSTRYGVLFAPQVVLAILASGLAPKLARRWGLRRVLLAGLVGDFFSMGLLALSGLLMDAPDAAFAVLLLATASLGLGFGATVMALNTYAEAFFPERADRAVLALNALLGVGTALAPALVAVVVALGAWWLLPVVAAGILVLLFGVAWTQPLRTAEAAAAGGGAGPPASIGWADLPRRFWLYAASVFVYGFVETLSGCWAVLYLGGERGVSAQGASLALTAFWAMVTVGRLLIAVVSRIVPARWIYVGLPLALVIAFQLAARVQGEMGGIVVFGLVGLACSGFLPLSISFGGGEFPRLAAVMSGGLIAFYQLGYGLAAFGVGPLQSLLGWSFSTIFAAGSLVALPLAVIALFLVRRSRPANA